MGVEYKVDVREVADDEEARALARTLNADRRHLTEEQRKEVVALLASETVTVVVPDPAQPGGKRGEEVARHSPEAIAGALGVDRKTVVADIKELGNVPKFSRPEKTLGQDGKVRKRDASAREAAKAPPGALARNGQHDEVTTTHVTDGG